MVIGIDVQILLERQAKVIHLLGGVLAHPADVPGFVIVAGDGLLAERIADDEAIAPAVLREPLALVRLGEGIVRGVAVDGVAGLVLGVAGTRRDGVGIFLAVAADHAAVDLLLEIIAAVIGVAEDLEPLVGGIAAQALEGLLRLRQEPGVVLRGEAVALVGDEDVVDIGASVLHMQLPHGHRHCERLLLIADHDVAIPALEANDLTILRDERHIGIVHIEGDVVHAHAGRHADRYLLAVRHAHEDVLRVAPHAAARGHASRGRRGDGFQVGRRGRRILCRDRVGGILDRLVGADGRDRLDAADGVDHLGILPLVHPPQCQDQCERERDTREHQEQDIASPCHAASFPCCHAPPPSVIGMAAPVGHYCIYYTTSERICHLFWISFLKYFRLLSVFVACLRRFRQTERPIFVHPYKMKKFSPIHPIFFLLDC